MLLSLPFGMSMETLCDARIHAYVPAPEDWGESEYD